MRCNNRVVQNPQRCSFQDGTLVGTRLLLLIGIISKIYYLSRKITYQIYIFTRVLWFGTSVEEDIKNNTNENDNENTNHVETIINPELKSEIKKKKFLILVVVCSAFPTMGLFSFLKVKLKQTLPSFQ